MIQPQTSITYFDLKNQQKAEHGCDEIGKEHMVSVDSYEFKSDESVACIFISIESCFSAITVFQCHFSNSKN